MFMIRPFVFLLHFNARHDTDVIYCYALERCKLEETDVGWFFTAVTVPATSTQFSRRHLRVVLELFPPASIFGMLVSGILALLHFVK